MHVPSVSYSVVRVSGRVVVFGLLFSESAQASSVNWGSVQDISGPGTSTVTTTKTDGGPEVTTRPLPMAPTTSTSRGRRC